VTVLIEPQPIFPQQEGSFSVDYRNYDGRIIIGNGDWSFETRWSAAGQGIIHVLNDAPNVRAVAVAPAARLISDVTADIFARSNFTSRARSPRVGQVVLVENTNGYVAAVQINDVRLSEEGEPGTVLAADFKILTDRSRDFSGAINPNQLAAIAAIDDALRELQLIEILDDGPSDPEIATIGHNQPPSEFALTAADLSELNSTLFGTREIVAEPQISGSDIEKSIAVISAKSSKIKRWIASRFQDVQSGAFQAAGAVLTTATILKLSGLLDYVVEALRALF
jgi:hypothetical protein